MEAYPSLTAVLVLLTALVSAALANPPQGVSTSQPTGAKAGDEVTFTCDYPVENPTFVDVIQWGKVDSSGNFNLIASNMIVEPAWRSVVIDVTTTHVQAKLTMQVQLVNQTGTYRCQLRRGSCTPSPATTCVNPLGDVPLKVYGTVRTLGWARLDNATIVATVDTDTALEYFVTATSDVSEYIRIYLGLNEISNDFEHAAHLNGDVWTVTGTGHHQFTRADNEANLRIEVSVPLHSKESSSAVVQVQVPPQVDCPELVSATLGEQGRISCLVTSALELTSLSWTTDGGEVVINVDEGEADGLSSIRQPQGSPNVYTVVLQVSKIDQSHFRTFKLVAENQVGRSQDEVSLREVVIPAVTDPAKILSYNQPTGVADVLSPKIMVATSSLLLGMASSLVLLRP